VSLIKELTQELFGVLFNELEKPENKDKINCCIDPIFLYVQSYIQPYFLLLIGILMIVMILNIFIIILLSKKT
jgi:hypothetical protein